MNEVIENNKAFAGLRNFYFRYQKVIFWIFISIIIVISVFLINYQVEKSNTEKAAQIYNNWIEQETETEEGKKLSQELFDKLINSHAKSGYTKIALMQHASLQARNGELNASLTDFLILVQSTNGFRGNKLFNKIARINSARILYALEDYDKALEMLEKYSSSSDAFIHELLGDILTKKNKLDLAKKQYELAKENYNDQTSISIVSMKISNLAS